LPRIKPGWLLVSAINPSLTLVLSTRSYGIAQKDQMGFDKAVEVRPKPFQALTNLI